MHDDAAGAIAAFEHDALDVDMQTRVPAQNDGIAQDQMIVRIAPNIDGWPARMSA